MKSPRRHHRLTGTVIAFACALLPGALASPALGSGGGGVGTAATAHLRWWFAGPMASTWPGLPPPLTPEDVRRFVALMTSYELVAADRRSITFGEWLWLNGVTEPREWYCMMWLYWNHVRRMASE